MNIEQLENNIHSLVANLDEHTFIFDLLLAYEQPKSSITRLKKGDYNLSKTQGEILWKKKLFFKKESIGDLHILIDELKSNPAITKHHPRFIIVTDFKTLLSVDSKTNDTLDIPIKELTKHYDFFLPWAGLEKAVIQGENPADIKAAERMGRLYDIILEENPPENDYDRHALNVFLSRLLFSFFAEDTGIFADDQFTNALASHTSEDGSDLKAYLEKFFKVLNLPERSSFPQFLQDFPYVNGGLFAEEYPVPTFDTKSRRIIIECGALNWKAINPDIFGSMIQAVMHDDQRGSMGMHYTSVVNIMKVIEPLFLDDLHKELDKAGNKEGRLNKLLERLYHLRIFDPACGSGNFLIIAYKELCKLEIEVFKRLHFDRVDNQDGIQLTFKFTSKIRINQFYGIELDDFAHETAKLSLWLSEHQMNLAFQEVFGETRPTLPLQESGHIVCGNATRLDWEDVCPKDGGCEIYVLGNPPYVGFQKQSESQKADIILVFAGFHNFKRIDYIGCWFKKTVDYIRGINGAFAFVSTNSICQGEQVCLIWPYVFSKGMSIFFAHQSFSWGNNAKHAAKVTCIIVGMKDSRDVNDRYIYAESTKKLTKNISPYLMNTRTVIVKPRNKPISSICKMSIGNVPLDGNNFILNQEEKDELVHSCPKSVDYIKRYMGASDFLKGKMRYCIWVTEDNKDDAAKIPFIRDRIEKCRVFRAKGGIVARQHVHVAYRFRTQPHQDTQSIIFPKTSSSKRKYVPAGFLDQNTVISEKALASYGAATYIFGVLSSTMHMIWLSVTSSRMRKDYQYSVQLTYNTFPFPEISEAQKTILEGNVLNLLDERELYPEKTMAEMYDPNKMPDGLHQAHHEMDLAVEQCYRKRPFENDEERLEYLFELYEEMIAAEKR
jgi:hypothetical protein